MKLKLSSFVLPQIRQGLHDLVPQNLAPGPDRIHYARSVIQIVTNLLDHGFAAEAKRFREESLFGPRLVAWTEDEAGKVTLEPLPELENALGFDLEQIGVLFRDGRIRDDSAMTYLPTGAATPQFADLLCRLHRGIERTELLERAAEHDIGFDAELLADLMARGVIEEAEVATPSPDPGPAIVWLGHAFVRATTGAQSVWFDPFPAPRVAWTPDERTSVFAASVPDAFLLANYGPDAHQVTVDELAIPAAVFVTHQDTDHIDFGTIALLPPSVPIYVPPADPRMPWQLDLVVALRTVLGEDRDVRVLRHDDSVRFGDLVVTAFPFVGEFPTSLAHDWNCYLVELPDQIWALCADSAVTPRVVEWLSARVANDPRPFGIMVNGIVTHRFVNGYRDTTTEPATFSRLYSWYLPPARTFEPTPACGLPVELLRTLVAEAHLSQVYLYAHGNLPWYRMEGTYLHHSHVGSHTLQAFEHMEQLALQGGARVVRLVHGVAHTPNPVSVLPRR